MANNLTFIDEVWCEIERARRKFPDQTIETTLIALTEEVGELAQAYLHIGEGKGSRQRVHDEAVQVAVMAMRVATEFGFDGGGEDG